MHNSFAWKMPVRQAMNGVSVWMNFFKNQGPNPKLTHTQEKCTIFDNFVNVFSRKALIGDTIRFLRFLLEMGPPFYVVIRATRRSSHFRAKAVPSFLSHVYTLSVGPVPGLSPRPPALQSSALPTELTCCSYTSIPSIMGVNMRTMLNKVTRLSDLFIKKLPLDPGFSSQDIHLMLSLKLTLN